MSGFLEATFVGYICSVLRFFLCWCCVLLFLDWWGSDLTLFEVDCLVNPKGSDVSLTPERVWFRLTRKGMVTDILNSSLDLSFYALFVRKSIYAPC